MYSLEEFFIVFDLCIQTVFLLHQPRISSAEGCRYLFFLHRISGPDVVSHNASGPSENSLKSFRKRVLWACFGCREKGMEVFSYNQHQCPLRNPVSFITVVSYKNLADILQVKQSRFNPGSCKREH